MYKALVFIIFFGNAIGTLNNAVKYPTLVVNPMCATQKTVPAPVYCQPDYKPPATNVAMYPQNTVINSNQIGFVTQPGVQQPVIQPTVNTMIPNPIVSSTNIATAPVLTTVASSHPGNLSTTFLLKNPSNFHAQTTFSNFNQGTDVGHKLSTVLSENPIAATQLINFLEYNGVPPPWDQLLDFETTQHHQLPDPDSLFKKIRKQLLEFETVKSGIVEGFIVVEKYINRGKAYLAEDLKDLCRDKVVLGNILSRLRTKPSYEFRSELFKRYGEVKTKSLETQKSFNKLRGWLMKIKSLFDTL